METERLILRESRPEDEAGIYEYASDPEVVRFADWGPCDISTVRANLHRRLEEQKNWPRDNIQAAVELRSDASLIGIMRITVLDHVNRRADFGYTFNRRYWNNGYATEGTRALLELAFSRLNLHRVWATCDVRLESRDGKAGDVAGSTLQKGCSAEKRMAGLFSVCNGTEFGLTRIELQNEGNDGKERSLQLKGCYCSSAQPCSQPLQLRMWCFKPLMGNRTIHWCSNHSRGTGADDRKNKYNNAYAETVDESTNIRCVTVNPG